jgi:hypothetical protein
LAGLKEQERVVEKISAARAAAEPRHQTGQHARLAEGPRRRRRQPVRGDVVDHAAHPRQHAPGSGVIGIEPPEEVSQLRQGDGGVVHDPKLKKLVDVGRRLALEHAHPEDTGVEQQFGARAGRPSRGRSASLRRARGPVFRCGLIRRRDFARSRPKIEIARNRAFPRDQLGAEIVLQRHLGERVFHEVRG